MRFAAIALLAGLLAPAAGRAAEADPYIFDLLALQPYKGNFARLVRPKDVPDWVKAIAAQGTGAAGPAKTVAIAGVPYRLDRVCKVGAACATDRIDVLWGPRGSKVWAALVEDGKPAMMLGEPKGAQAAALEAAGGGALATPTPSGQAAVALPAPVAPRSAPSAAGAPDPYIFDLLALQPYKGNFARLVRPKDVPDWVKAIAAQGTGTAGPARTVAVAGTPYRLDRVCKVGAGCATDRIDVLWGPHGSKVWAALVEDGRPPVMLGGPKGAQAEALAGAGPAAPAPQ